MNEAEWLACDDPGPMLEFLRGKASARKLRLLSTACTDRLLALLSGRLKDRLPTKAIEEFRSLASEWVANDSEWAASGEAADSAGYAARYAVRIAGYAGEGASAEERTIQAALLRCVFGNPFRPVKVSPSWRTPSALGLAQQFHDSPDVRVIRALGDALKQAGCTDTDILAHCLRPAEHVRGCWVVELLTGPG